MKQAPITAKSFISALPFTKVGRPTRRELSSSELLRRLESTWIIAVVSEMPPGPRQSSSGAWRHLLHLHREAGGGNKKALLVMRAIAELAFAQYGALGDPLSELLGEAVPQARQRAEARIS